jgi:hypothetical protein
MPKSKAKDAGNKISSNEPSEKQSVTRKPSRADEAREVAEEYANDQREILKKLRNSLN